MMFDAMALAWSGLIETPPAHKALPLLSRLNFWDTQQKYKNFKINSIINLSTQVRSILLLNIFILISLTGTAQIGTGWKVPRFYILDINKATGKGDDLFSYLEKDITEPEKNSCSATWGIFFFRITAKGKVDSLFHEGPLENTVTNQIIKNIYATNGHWKIPKETKVTEKLWFIFPYFYIGHGYNKCSEADKLLIRNVMGWGESIGTISLYSGLKGAYLIRSSMNGAGYGKE